MGTWSRTFIEGHHMTITFHRGNAFAGKTRSTKYGEVIYVGADVPADIDYRQFTADYSDSATRKFMVTATRRRYGSLETAAAAAVKARAQTGKARPNEGSATPCSGDGN